MHAGLNALFDRGDAEPLRAGADGGRSAAAERVAVGIGLDDGEQFGVRCGRGGKDAVVFFEGAGVDLNPAGAN